MKKRFVSAALAAVMALSMTACGSSNSAAETTAADTEAAESQAEETTAEEAKTTDGGTLIVGFDQDFPEEESFSLPRNIYFQEAAQLYNKSY